MERVGAAYANMQVLRLETMRMSNWMISRILMLVSTFRMIKR